MALDYDLHLSTSMKPAQALEKLAGQLTGLAWSEDRFSLFDTTVSICAIENRSESIKEAFHFNPTLLVGFRRLFDADWDRFRQVLLDATLLLLDEAQDAVLLFNGERIELQRLGGQLAFNAESGYWRDKDWLKSRLTLPFDWRPLPSPLL
ncbi:SitI3 family protein [Archangium sp.]|uniref:SitI3 family protein n=1 Tax=Archangium sp. TaxID=1872627 RepID=UPI002D6B454B|nr:SitI3 family protein [Archangium sp.]HYO56740.1 SitI3 family protein [Archangium sp.]